MKWVDNLKMAIQWLAVPINNLSCSIWSKIVDHMEHAANHVPAWTLWIPRDVVNVDSGKKSMKCSVFYRDYGRLGRGIDRLTYLR